MKTATVADLRNNFRRLSAWIENGEAVEIIKRGHVFAHLVPPTPVAKAKKANYMARLQAAFPRPLTLKEVKQMREAELEGEEG